MASLDNVHKSIGKAHDIVVQAIVKVYSDDLEKQAFAMFVIDEYEYALRHQLELNNDDRSTKKSDA